MTNVILRFTKEKRLVEKYVSILKNRDRWV